MSTTHCHELLGELSAYLDGEAAQHICTEIERHMADCANCRAVVNTLDRTVELYRTLPTPPAPDDVTTALWRVLQLP